MNKQAKSLLIVMPICFVLAGLTVLLYLIDPKFEASAFIILSMVLVAIWAFFFVPALIHSIVWAKNYFEKLTFEQSFRLGYFVGCGWGALVFLLFLIISPVIGTIWFVKTIIALKTSIKNSRNSTEISTDINDVYDL